MITIQAAMAETTADTQNPLERLSLFACNYDLVKNDQARQGTIALLSRIYNSPDAQGNAPDIEPDAMIKRAEISECLQDAYLDHISTDIKDTQTKLAMQDIQWANRVLLTQIAEQLLFLDPRILFSPEMLPVIRQANIPIPIAKVWDALNVYPDLFETIQQIEPYIHETIPPERMEGRLQSLAQQVTLWYDEAMTGFGTRVLVRTIARNGFYLTEQGTKYRLQQLRDEIAFMQEQPALNEEEQAFLQMLRDSMEVLEAPDYKPLSVQETVWPIGIVYFTNNVFQGMEIFLESYNQVLAENQKGIHFKNLVFQEGDIALGYRMQSPETLLQTLNGSPSAFNEAYVIAGQQLAHEWMVYYAASIGASGLSYHPIDELSDFQLLVSPEYAQEAGFSTRILSNMTGSTVERDWSYSLDAQESGEPVAFYPAEFIARFITEAGGPAHALTPVSSAQPGTHTENLNRLGMNGIVEDGLIILDGLTAEETVTPHFMSFKTGGVHPQRLYLEKRLMQVVLNRLSGMISAHLLNTGGNHQPFANLMEIYEQLVNVPGESEWPDSARRITEAERNDIKVRFHEDVLARLILVFQKPGE